MAWTTSEFWCNVLAGQDLCLLPRSFMELLWVVLPVACPCWRQLAGKSIGMMECTDGTKEGNRKLSQLAG